MDTTNHSQTANQQINPAAALSHQDMLGYLLYLEHEKKHQKQREHAESQLVATFKKSA